ncbi:XRE family transcriptional regulator [Lactobacillus helveticus]|nr:helix-turn-helix transcriptional regulator [Lactobacillus helveticus]MCT0164024.1 XRE family transcriptional regulator [Lactobacillus helveticus]
MNRIKEVRKKKGLSLQQVADAVGVGNNTISRYETGKREPKIETWDKLAKYFNVPTSYLMGLSDDVNGWKEWAENTGYSVKQIKDEIQRLIKTKRLDSSTNIQHQIAQAVKSLDSSSYSTTQGVQHELVFQLTTLINKVDNAFLEPQKKSKNLNYNPPQIRKDMDEKAYKKIIDALTKAKYEIEQIPIDKKYLP